MKKEINTKFCNIIILGRPNVGKSSIFNFLISKNEAIVRNEEGTTVDVRSKIIGNIIIWDTPGIFTYEELNIKKIDYIYFVIENNVLNSDKKIYLDLKKKFKNVLVIINKIDKNDYDDYSFFQNHIKISIKSGIGLHELKSVFFDNYDDNYVSKEKKIWAILGRPNVGKSSLINLLADNELHSVSSEQGTTKEFLPVDIDNNIILDTPGQRKKALFPLYANVFGVIIVLDPDYARQDMRFIGEMTKRKKPIIVIFNKIDLIKDIDLMFLEEKIYKIWGLKLLKFSCIRNSNINNIVNVIRSQEQKYQKRIQTSKLNFWLKKNVQKHEPKLKFISQVEVSWPKFFCDHKLAIDKEKMLKKMISRDFNLDGIPLDIIYKEN